MNISELCAVIRDWTLGSSRRTAGSPCSVMMFHAVEIDALHLAHHVVVDRAIRRVLSRTQSQGAEIEEILCFLKNDTDVVKTLRELRYGVIGCRPAGSSGNLEKFLEERVEERMSQREEDYENILDEEDSVLCTACVHLAWSARSSLGSGVPLRHEAFQDIVLDDSIRDRVKSAEGLIFACAGKFCARTLTAFDVVDAVTDHAALTLRATAYAILLDMRSFGVLQPCEGIVVVGICCVTLASAMLRGSSGKSDLHEYADLLRKAITVFCWCDDKTEALSCSCEGLVPAKVRSMSAKQWHDISKLLLKAYQQHQC